MKQTVTEHQFMEAFRRIRPDNFSYEGLLALWGFMEEHEDSTGEELELDVIGICCDFAEYGSLADFQANYGDEYETLDDIEDRTTVIRIPGGEGFIIQIF